MGRQIFHDPHLNNRNCVYVGVMRLRTTIGWTRAFATLVQHTLENGCGIVLGERTTLSGSNRA